MRGLIERWMDMKNIRFEEVNYDYNDFIYLSNEMDEYLNIAVGGEQKREKYKAFNSLDTMDYVIVAYAGDVPAGCAALRKFSENKIEVKRVFVREAYRKNSVATGIIRRLIDYAVDNGYDKMILETGGFLRESVRLYTDFGFYRISNYGPYADMEESLCMELNLTKIRYSFQRGFQTDELKELYQSVGWLSADYADRMTKAFHNAGTIISAWAGKQLIGLAEVIDDGELTAYIHYLLVRSEYQGQGVGKKLLELTKKYYKNYLYLIVISEERKNVGFYENCGFVAENTATPLKILRV